VLRIREREWELGSAAGAAFALDPCVLCTAMGGWRRKEPPSFLSVKCLGKSLLVFCQSSVWGPGWEGKEEMTCGSTFYFNGASFQQSH
jgi:hypothetical protein